ncbi:hypothetical protein DXG03_006226 [Asterophora parasitica]|uniref:Uncharacterized protein n=1 Tax=Asterophora parasitica TaxID=117018 RepID=A0A9P7GE93_9AGAR|nr:hypothetical protein DXG03_006226 [Asterophora parasitica]
MAFPPKRTLSQDSDFSNTFEWLISFDTVTSDNLKYRQSIPSDIMRFDDLDFFSHSSSPITTLLGRTALGVDFDYSCLEGLDNQLLFHPTDAFAAICWAEAVDEPAGPLPDYLRSRLAPITSVDVERLVTSSDDLSESDTDESLTFTDDILPALQSRESFAPMKSLPNVTITAFDERTPLANPCYIPGESDISFPVHNYREQPKAPRIAAFRAYLPLRRKSSSLVA